MAENSYTGVQGLASSGYSGFSGASGSSGQGSTQGTTSIQGLTNIQGTTNIQGFTSIGGATAIGTTHIAAPGKPCEEQLKAWQVASAEYDRLRERVAENIRTVQESITEIDAQIPIISKIISAGESLLGRGPLTPSQISSITANLQSYYDQRKRLQTELTSMKNLLLQYQKDLEAANDKQKQAYLTYLGCLNQR